MEEYKAAVTTYRNLLKDFPGSRYREEAMLNIFKSMYFYAERSVPSKQQERFRDALDAYNAFVASYPESRFIKSIRNLRDNMPVEVSSAAI